MKSKNTHILVFLFALMGFWVAVVSAQLRPDTSWTRTYGGVTAEISANFVLQTSDGGYAMAGRTSSFGAGSFDFYLVKTDSVGDTLWTRTYGDSADDQCFSFHQTTDGGYILAGITNSYGAGDYDFYLVKTDSVGDTLWTRTFGDVDWEEARSVQQTADGGYIIVGYSRSFGAGYLAGYLVKTDSVGDTLWTQIYDATISDDRLWSVQQTTDGGYIMAGDIYGMGPGSYDGYIVKTDSVGDTLWTTLHGGTDVEVCYSIQQTTDGGYIACGDTRSFGAISLDVWLFKLDSLGQVLWNRTYGDWYDEHSTYVQQLTDGGYIISGSSNSFSPTYYPDGYLVRTDSVGDTLWTGVYGGLQEDFLGCIKPTMDGGYIAGGSTQSFGAGNQDFWLVKFAPEPPDLQVLSPNGGEEWIVEDTTASIAWSYEAGYDSFDVLLSRDSGASWDTLESGLLPPIADWIWSTGVTPPTSFVCLIKIVGYYDGFQAYDISDSVFSIVVPTLVVTNPNGGEIWRILHLETVNWTGYGFEGGVKIELNTYYPVGDWEVLVDSTENDGEEEIIPILSASNQCRVKISSLNDTLSDISDGNFYIISSQAILALTRPGQPGVPVYSWDAGFLECPPMTATESFRLTNFGSETIAIYAPGAPFGQHFSRETNCPASFNLLAGQTSTCYLDITYEPLEDGTHLDTIQITTDALNGVGGYVSIPLSGQRTAASMTPMAPDVVITVEGYDARLTWDPITESVGGCPISVDAYLVFYSPTLEGPYYYHGDTSDTTYVHSNVVLFAPGMFYEVQTYTGPLSRMDALPTDPEETPITREETFELLYNSR